MGVQPANVEGGLFFGVVCQLMNMLISCNMLYFPDNYFRILEFRAIFEVLAKVNDTKISKEHSQEN